MPQFISRRSLLFTGAALLVAGCTRQSPEAQAQSSTDDGDGLWYVVQRGDTLSGISRKSGVAVQSIADANGLATNILAIGQRLWLPGAVTVLEAPLPQRPAQPGEPGRPAIPRSDDPYRLVPRSAWTSRQVAKNNTPMGAITRITIHHTDEHAGMRDLPDIEVVRRIENYHRSPKPSGRGWSSIGYHYLVGKEGDVFEGRPLRYQGAHVSGANEHNVGISVIGDFMHKLPNPRQLAALEAFLDDTRARLKIGKARVYGHRDLGSSVCPGDALYAWVKRFKAA